MCYPSQGSPQGTSWINVMSPVPLASVYRDRVQNWRQTLAKNLSTLWTSWVFIFAVDMGCLLISITSHVHKGGLIMVNHLPGRHQSFHKSIC